MKIRHHSAFDIRFSAFTAVAAAVALAWSALTSHANLLTNPGFESGDGHQVSDWTCFGNAWQSTNHARSGPCSLKLYGTWSGPWNASGVYQTLPARPGQRWTLSGYGLNASDDALAGQNYALIKIVWFSGPNGTGDQLQPLPGPGAVFGQNPGIESAQLTNATPINIWQFLSASGVAPPGTMSVQLLGGLFLQPNYESGAAWFDDLKASATPAWGHALSFDGVNDYGVFSRPVSNDFTLECWFRSTQMAGSDGQWYFGMGLVDGEVAGTTNDFGLSLGAGKVLFGTGGTSDTTIHSGVVADGQWHHAAATRERASGAMKLYVDGQLVASGTNDTNTLTAPLQMRVGSLATGINFFQGELDDIRLWNVARTSNEISQSLVYPLTGTESNLVAYWKLDEGTGATATSTTNGYPATLVGPQWTPSTIPLWGNALSFDGVNDYVQAGAVPLANSSFTLEAWARRYSTNTIDIILGQGSASTRVGLHFGFHYSLQNKFVLGFYNDDLFTTNSYTDNDWHHWAGTYDAATRQRFIYRDGVLVASGIASANYQGSGPLLIATPPWGTGGGAFHGRIDEVRIWNKARTQAEIAADMLHPLTGAESNLVACWSFDEAPTSVARDATLNHYDGILTNGTAGVSSIVSAPNLPVNPGFENGSTGWSGFGWATLIVTNSISHSGSFCGYLTNRNYGYAGVAQSFLGVLQPGVRYNLSAWVRLENSPSNYVGLTFLKTDGSGTSYEYVAGCTATSNQWTRLGGSYTLAASGALTELTLYMDGPAPGVNFYADDFVVAPDLAYAPLVLGAATLPACGLLNSNAKFNGAVQPGGLPTTAWFEWRTNRVYANTTAPIPAGSGWEDVSVTNALTDLTPGLIYHYRLVASNRLGVARGANQMFWTPALRLNSRDPLTNECHVTFADPTTVNASPLAIAAGEYYSLVLKADSTVVGWGDNDYGQANGALAGSNVVAIAAGGRNSLALKADGTVVGWGDQPDIPADLSNVVAIAAGGWHSLVLKVDGTVVEWGLNGIPAGLINVVAIAAGGSDFVSPSGHSLALKANGTVVGWGINWDGETNVPSGLNNVVAIAAGGFHSLALKADGTVVGWGENWDGQTNGALAGSNVVAIAAGSYHSLALKADGTVVGWGRNNFGQANGALAGGNVVAIEAGGHHSLALKADGTVVGWGANWSGQTNIPANAYQLGLPIAVSGTPDTNTPGLYELTYRTTNSLGAVATATRTVVVADTLPPKLTLVGENPLMLELGAPFTDPGATASDLCAGDRTANILFTNTVNPHLAGAYTSTFTVADASGNVAATNRLVLVVARPVLTGLEHLSDGVFQFTFTSTPGARFNVLTTTNLSLPTSQWTVLGPATEGPPGQFQFTDVGTTNHPARFYQLRGP